jgi:hypothetical protein
MLPAGDAKNTGSNSCGIAVVKSGGVYTNSPLTEL